MVNFFGYFVKDRIKELASVVEMWGNCFVALSDVSQTVPHQSKPEETNVGILAGAAWRAGWVAFQEMSRRKAGLGSYGYCDLWLKRDRIPSSKYYLECKGAKVESEKDMKKLLNLAVDDIMRLNTEEDDSIKIALAFCNIQFKNINSFDETTKKVAELILSVRHSMDFDLDIYAHCFPGSVRKYSDKEYCFPGVMMIGKVVDETTPIKISEEVSFNKQLKINYV